MRNRQGKRVISCKDLTEHRTLDPAYNLPPREGGCHPPPSPRRVPPPAPARTAGVCCSILFLLSQGTRRNMRLRPFCTTNWQGAVGGWVTASQWAEVLPMSANHHLCCSLLPTEGIERRLLLRGGRVPSEEPCG